MPICIRGASQVTLVVKNWLASAGDIRDTSSIPELGRCPQRRELLPTPAFLPGKSHEQRSLVGYSPCGCKESDMTEQQQQNQTAQQGAGAQWPPSPHLLLIKPNMTGSLASLDGVAQHSVRTTFRLLFCL